MKKSLVAAVLTLGLVGNVFASCGNTPYIAPDEMQPACAEAEPVVHGLTAAPAVNLKADGAIDSISKSDADVTQILVLDKSSDSGV